jgi:hypothetical protein
LNAAKTRVRPGAIKVLDEPPPIPITENGTSELVRKILQKKKTENREEENHYDNHSSEPHQNHIINHQQIPKMEEKKDEIADFSSMTAAELRKNSAGNYSKTINLIQ